MGSTRISLPLFDGGKIAQFNYTTTGLGQNGQTLTVAIWETIDNLVSTLLPQDPQAAADNYKEALCIGTLVLPSKLPKEILPFDRAKEIQGNMFKYYNIKNWKAMFDIICDQNWLHAKAMALKPSAFNPLSIGQHFDSQAEEFGMHMFNIPKVIETSDVLGVLSHGLDTIGKPKLKQVMKAKVELSGLDVHIMDMEAQNIHGRLRRLASQGGHTPSKQQPIEGTHVLAEIQAKEAEAAAGHPYTHAYSTRLQESSSSRFVIRYLCVSLCYLLNCHTDKTKEWMD